MIQFHWVFFVLRAALPLAVALHALVALAAPSASSEDERSSGAYEDGSEVREVERPPFPGPPIPPPIELKRTIWVAHVLRRRTQVGIHELYIPDVKVPMFLHTSEGRIRPLVKVVLDYSRPGWGLYGPDGALVRRTAEDKIGQVAIFAYLNGHLNQIELTAKGPNEAVEMEKIFIYAPDAYEFKLVSPWNELLVSFGAANLVYDQSSYGRFTSLTGILSAQYSSPNRTTRFGAFGDVSMTILSFRTSPVNAQPQLIDGHLDVSYLVNKNFISQWRTQVLGGMSYISMLPNGSDFGFSNLVSPELGVKTRYVLSRNRAWGGEISYSPMGAPFKSYGLNMALWYDRLLGNSHRGQFGFGTRLFSYQKQETQVMGQLYSLMLGYSI